ncbi:MAG: protein kinase [Deltaproteobacteria bacterium]|nr:protein kinase [Deltaproteobacteria bacterium]
MNACPNDGWSFSVDVDATVHPQSSPPVRMASAPAAIGALATAGPAIAESSDLVAGFVVGEYRIEKKIGEGGMGAVYSAMHPMIGKRAAIKVISTALGTDASAVNRFVQEARSVNQIGHPNIVDVFAFGELPDGRNYFVMEYLQGESLADRIQRVAMPLGEAIEILDQICDALEAAHENQIVHRDLKPDNVYLAAVRGGRTLVKLLDFGIAKLADAPGTGGGIAKTRTGMMMGTPGYLSPEQARGKNVDHRTDVYALGCMVFEIVCGRLPFVADNAMDIVLMHMTAKAPRPREFWPEIPAPLDELISRMLEKDASLRPSLAEVRSAFAALVTSGLVTLTNGRGVSFRSGMSGLVTPGHGMAVGTHPVGPAPSTSPPTTSPATMSPGAAAPKKRGGLMFGVIAGLLVVGAIVGVAATRGGDDKQPAASQVPAVATATEPPKTEPPKTEPPKVAVVEPVPAKQPGAIELAVNVDKAQVTFDGKPVAITGRKAMIPVETEGSHTVMITASGREPFQQQIDVKAGATVKLVATLERSKGTKKPPVAGGKKPPPTGAGSGTKPKTEDKNYTVDPFAN